MFAGSISVSLGVDLYHVTENWRAVSLTLSDTNFFGADDRN